MHRPTYSIAGAVSIMLIAACAGVAAEGAADILTAAGVKGGLVVHLGCGDGKLTAALRASDSYLVHGLDADPANVAAARRHVRSLGLYGKVTVERWTSARLPYADNLVNLVVAQDLGTVPMNEVMRALAPNGVAYIKTGGAWRKTVKPRPKAIDEWTHYLHDASNNAVAADTVVGPPRRVQWICGPQWARTHDHLSTTSAVVSAGGRMFYIIDEGSTAFAAMQPKWKLVARDAFNGVLLWKRPIGPWEGHLRDFRSGPAELARRLVAVGDRVYVTLGYGKPVTALDAATGKTVTTYKETKGALEFICHQGVLLVVAGDRPPDNTAGAAIPKNPKDIWHWWPIYRDTPPKKRIVAVRAETGKLLWQKNDADTVELLPTTLAAAGDRVFFQGPKEIIALGAGSGSVQWRTERPIARARPSWTAPTLVVYGGVVLSADRAVGKPPAAEGKTRVQWTVTSVGGVAPPGQLVAFSAETGKKLWSGPARECYNAPVDVLVADGLVWTGSLVGRTDPGITAGRDVKTGQVKRTRPKDPGQFPYGPVHHRCYRNKATDRYLVLGRDGIEFIDIASGKGQGNSWVRGACQYGVMPCNGLVYVPPHSCACHIETKLSNFNVLAPAAPARGPGAKSDGPRLEQGPAYSDISNRKSQISNDDWPTYRGNAARSGRAGTAVPANLAPKWQTKIGGPSTGLRASNLSTVTVAGGKLFVAAIDDHTVHALNAEDGKPAWSYTASGRVDSPPTIWQGTAIFGCSDGWVYSLRATDGKLAWRFRAAPASRRVVSYGQLESAWPVHGSVLVVDGAVYAVAGRSAYLDGGMVLYRLDAKTGKMLSTTRITTGALPDVLSSDGTSVFMRHKRFNTAGVEQQSKVAHLYSSAGFLDGQWWHRTYWQVGTTMQSTWGGWPNVGNRVPSGRLLVLDASSVYGFGRLNQYHRNGSHVGMGKMQYRLFACARKPKPAGPAPKPAAKRRRRPAATKIAVRWSQRAALMARGMVLSGKTLFVAGPPDVLGNKTPEGNHPYTLVSAKALAEQEAAFAGRKGAVLWAVSADDGKKLSELKLAAPPVWDGMAAANGRLYIATQDGRILCFAGK